MRFVSNDPVEAFVLPKRTGPVQTALDALRGKPFPGAAQLFQPVFSQRTAQSVDVIGHHDIGKHLAAIALEVVQSLNHDPAMHPITKQALAMTFIEHGFELSETGALKLVPSCGEISR